MGDTVKGVIVSMKKQQQTDMTTKQPAFWDNGDPKMMLVVVLQTDLREEDDDEGLRTVYLRGGNPKAVKGKGTSSLNAVKDALRRSGQKLPEVGATLSLQYSGEGERPNKAFNPPKLYLASYDPPSYSVDINEMA